MINNCHYPTSSWFNHYYGLKITIFKIIMRSRDLPSIRNWHYSTYLILAFVTLFWTLFFRQCTGIPLLIYWVKPWNVLMEDVYVMGPQSNKGSFMICSWMEGGLEYHWSIYFTILLINKLTYKQFLSSICILFCNRHNSIFVQSCHDMDKHNKQLFSFTDKFPIKMTFLSSIKWWNQY